MKDIEWLKNEVKSLFDEAYESGKMEYYESEESIHRINSLIDQLDEPETLSQEWLDENKVARINDLRKMTTSDVVPVEKLKNLLVPKQDKPVISQYEVSVDGCDDSTTIRQELTFEEYEFLNTIAEKITNTSNYGCMPTMQVEEVTQ